MSYSFSWSNSDSMVEVEGFDSSLSDPWTYTMPVKYQIFADSTNWQVFTDYYDGLAESARTTNEEANIFAYSDYVLRLQCDMSAFSTTDGSGCCIQDASSQAGGGYCVLYSATGTKAKTYFMKEEDFEDAVQAGTIQEDYYLEDDSDNDYGFEIFECPTASTSELDCYKFQPKPSAAYSTSFRFEKDNMAKAISFEAGVGFKDTFIVLEEAFRYLGPSTIVVATVNLMMMT